MSGDLKVLRQIRFSQRRQVDRTGSKSEHLFLRMGMVDHTKGLDSDSGEARPEREERIHTG